MKFSAIEGIIDDDLPLGALRNSEWWNNSENSTQGYAWTSAGWNVQSLDLNGRTVTFRKVIQDTHRPSRKRRKAAPQKPFTTVPEKPLKIRVPSKTHVARALARARNVERKMATTTYGGRFKPRRAYEKRLFKPDAKPSSNE